MHVRSHLRNYTYVYTVRRSRPPYVLVPSPPLSPSSVRDGVKLFLIIISLIGFFTFDMVYVTAVMNYAAQSEMLIYLLRSVRGLLEQKAYTEMDVAIKVLWYS